MGELEKLIGERFDVLAETFPSRIKKEDARVKRILVNSGDVQKKNVLEIGCGKGRVARIFKDMGAEIYGIDISEELLRDAKKIDPERFIKADAYNIPFGDNTFDIIYLMEVIEHIPDLEAMFAEAVRVLKENGKLIIVDRNLFSLNNKKAFVPNLLIKRYHELRNEWMYPRDFPYREKWFIACKIHAIFKRYFTRSGYEYILSDGEVQRWWHVMFKLIPPLRYFTLWYGANKIKTEAVKGDRCDTEGL